VVTVVEGESTRHLEITPGDLGLPNVETTALAAGGPEESAQRIEALLRCADEPAEAIVMANTALALWTAGRTESLHQGVEIARRALETGAALRVLERWRAWSRGIPQGEKP
jgi:anthranilate phosphoribosyltransferase